MGIMKYSRLGDTFYEDKARKINQALEKINAPYYQVCKKVRGSRANKDAFDISWRKRNITCDNDYPNATTTSEKVVMKQLEKNFGISLTLLNTDTLRAIKKSLDYQKAQQTILDNKLKAREERERAAAAKKEARAMAKNNKSSKTTATKSIPSSERNDNKESANRTNEILTEKNDNITYFYTIVKNGRRKNYAKLNTLTNRVQYLSSAVPIYVKEFIKTFKAKPSNAMTKVEEKKDIFVSKTPDIRELIALIANRVDGSLLVERSTDKSARVYKKNEFVGNLSFDTKAKDPNIFYIEAYKKGVNSPFMRIDGNFNSYKISSKFATDIKKLSAEYENSKSKSSPAKSTKAVEEKKESKMEEKKIEAIKTNKRADDDIEELVMVINSRLTGDIAIKKSLDSDRQFIVSNNNKYVGFLYIDKETIDNKKGFIIKAYKPNEQYQFMTIESTFSIYDISSKFAEQIKELSREYENSNKSTPKEEKKEMRPINEPETTEIIKETPPIMIDEDEAAKFDKGLDELTKLLQQAMQ